MSITPKTTAQRQADLRAARQRAGLREVRNLWAHPDDHATIRAKAAQLAQQRESAAAKAPATKAEKPK